MDLFEKPENAALYTAPLAARMRPGRLQDVAGQEQLIGDEGLLHSMIAGGRLSSMILWGPPGSGKTTIARLLASESDIPYHSLSAISSGVAELRQVISSASSRPPLLLFIDEIHRFNKGQQAALLAAVEEGAVILVGATTENPGFEVIAPLLSRCHVLQLEPLSQSDLQSLLQRALAEDSQLREYDLSFTPEAASLLVLQAGGDARRLYKILELCLTVSRAENAVAHHLPLTEEFVDKVLASEALPYDKGGDYHYDIISAFIKSIRGSDPDAGLYYLARMLASGEDPIFIARRLVILASEDIGNAAPNGLVLATSCFQACQQIGLPEAMYPLAQTVIYLSASPKSNSAASAILAARKYVDQHPDAAVPLHLRNAANKLLEQCGHGAGYLYPHDYPHHFTPQQYLPDAVDEQFYHPLDEGMEEKLQRFLAQHHNDWRSK
jgi:putative ATPase